MRKIGIIADAVGGLSAEEYVKTIASLGFETSFTGMGSERYHFEMAELFQKYGIEYETVHAPFGRINDIWKAGEDGDAMCRQLTDCVDRCALVGVPVAVVHLSSGIKAPSITDIGRERFAALVAHAKDKGVCIAFENQRKLANIAWAFEYFADAPNVGFCWDCGHEACFAGGREYMPLFGDKLICTHLHDNSGRPDDDQHLLPFDGSIDFGRVAKRLRESKYQGTLTLEIFDVNNHNYDFITPQAFLEKAAMVAKRLRRMVDGF